MKATFHLARDTFATLFLNKGTTIESLSKMMRYKNIAITQKYCKNCQREFGKDMQKVSH
ncbi:MAG TPA: tyrosine-type recombinase/integrase, partial [Flavobacterium sp.]